MSERYSKLFSLSENLYTEGSPVLIVAGALLKDNQTGKVIAQLKLSNISTKVIKSVTVAIFPLNTAGKTLGDVVRYEYLDLSSSRDTYFGSKSAIPLPDSSSRSFGVAVEEVVFMDNSLWSTNNELWEPLAKPDALDFRLDEEMVKQFLMEYGYGAKSFLLEQKDLWYCVCGAINHHDEKTCHSCRKSIYNLRSIDLDAMRRRKEQRLVQEQQQAEKEAAATHERIKKAKRTALIVLPSAAIVIAFFVLLNSVIIPNRKYNNAVSMMKDEKYEEALAIFEAIDGFKDSANMILESKYNIAISLMKSGKYEEAIIAFEEINGYKDSTDMILESKYNIAIALMESKEYTKAISAFEAIDNYKDCKEQSELCSYYVAEELYSEHNYLDAWEIFSRLNLLDSKKMAQQCSDIILSGYLKFTGLFKCDEGYTLSVYASFSDGVVHIYGFNSSYGHDKYEVTLHPDLDVPDDSITISYRVDGNSYYTTLLLEGSTVTQHYNGYYNYTFKRVA